MNDIPNALNPAQVVGELLGHFTRDELIIVIEVLSFAFAVVDRQSKTPTWLSLKKEQLNQPFQQLIAFGRQRATDAQPRKLEIPDDFISTSTH